MNGLADTTATDGSWGDGEVAEINYGVDDIPGFGQDYLNADAEEQALHDTKAFVVIVKHEVDMRWPSGSAARR